MDTCPLVVTHRRSRFANGRLEGSRLQILREEFVPTPLLRSFDLFGSSAPGCGRIEVS